MAAALVTLTGLSVVGLAAGFVLALTAQTSADISQHVLVAVFATTLNLFAHSLMMFYLLGKGRAVKEAMAEHGLQGDYMARVTRLRSPVFSRATVAMVLTMAASIVGASVDVQVMPPWPHGVAAAAAVVLNVYALWTEVVALRGTSRIVDEVNRRLIAVPVSTGD
jgi:hypothetical protein